MGWNGVLRGGIMQEIDQGQLLASIAATLHDCILSLDAAGVVQWASPATEGVLGWRPEDLAGSDVAVLFPLEAGDLRDSAIRRLLDGERVEPFVEPGVRRDGSAYKAQLTLGPVPGPDGGITGAIVVIRDVTAQLSEQRELAQALEMSRAHFDQATTPQAILDLDGHLESVNPAWCELFGHGEAWFADCDLLALVHPVDAEQVVTRLARLRRGEIDSISYRGLFRDADGEDLPLLLDASLLREPDGTPYAIAAWAGTEDDTQLALSEVLSLRAWDTAVVFDADLVITFVAGAVSRMLGYDRDEMLHHLTLEYVHPGDAAIIADLVERLQAEPRASLDVVVRVRDAEGHWRSLEVTATNCLADPDVQGYVANLRDVTERVRTEEALRLSEALHRAMVESAQEGILATSPDGLVIFVNETAADVLGRGVDRLYGEDPVRLLGLHTDTRVEVDGGVEVHEVVYRRPESGERTLRVSRRPLNSRNDRLGSLVSVSDVTDARHAESVLRSRALQDPLTGLPNRYLFTDRLETAAARHERSPGRGTSVLFIDVDGFKRVNDGFGHETGDGVLREIGARLLASTRTTDTVSRLGGDEFAVICEDTGADEALVVADRILAAFASPVVVEGTEHQVSISVGIAQAPPYSFDEVVRRADEAMYRAKQAGGGRVGTA
jgi:diguanylate cyclase (GGDEF)-like protein/PAS domain S-box-containing protein